MYSSKLSVSVHILCVVALGSLPVTSEKIAGSIGTNPALVRRLMGRLKAANLVEARTKLGATGLAKPAEQISLLDVFRAAEPQQALFDLHTGTNPECPVGANICRILTQFYTGAQRELEAALERVKLSDILRELPPALESTTRSE